MKKIILLAGAAALAFAFKDQIFGTSNSGSGKRTFQLATLTDNNWKGGVGVRANQPDWNSNTQFLLESAGNTDLMTLIQPGTLLQLADGTQIPVRGIYDLGIDQYLRIDTDVNLAPYVSSAGFPNQVTIV